MRILVNAIAARMGGALGHLNGLVRELEARPSLHEWTFLVDPAVRRQLRSVAVRVEAMPWGGPVRRVVADQAVLPLVARRTGADVLVSLLNHGPRFAGVPHVVFQRNAWYFDVPAASGARVRVQRALALAACRGASAIVAPTHAMAKAVRAAVGQRAEVVVIPHGVDTGFFRTGSGRRDDLPDPGLATCGHPRLVYVAHASRHKGHDELLVAFREVVGTFPDASLALTIGPDEPPEGGDRDRAHQLMAAARDMPGVRFVGRCGPEAVRALYAWADIAVFPSRLEAFGFPLVESMAMGLPVVASDLPALQEVAGNAALYHRPESARELAAHILRLARDPALHATLAKEGSTRAESFSLRRWVASTESLLDAVVDRRTVPASGAGS